MRSLRENMQSKNSRLGAESTLQERAARRRLQEMARKKEGSQRKVQKAKEKMSVVKRYTEVRVGKVRNSQLTGPGDLGKKGFSRSQQGEFKSGMNSDLLIRKKKPKK